ncbi:MAG: class II aldolase/adducin family protein, partial [Pseudomonadota bacterium]
MVDATDLTQKKDVLIATAKRCFDLRLQTNAGGNLSVRLDSADAIVIKPSGVGFNECTRDNLQVVHLDGRIEDSPHKPSKDLGFHLDLYRIRDDIRAVVHCHSPWATGYASAGLEIPCLTVQTIEKIGRMPLIPLSANGGPQTDVEI